MPSGYSLGLHFDTFVADLVASGRYASASDVMSEALRLLEDHETKRLSLREAIAEGLASGSAEAWSAEDVKAEGRVLLSFSATARSG